ncbi:hypothetical protein [Roseimaritima ulvae]|uniref:Chromosome partition protein Smc n=1 Tax=Roseimaritima ulvae TaxID=980254 RepID=A0A5B9QGP9_9BACT|nr:hypothetical protein [Roseimaritima ulvae]QEG38267.1 hypothetical protein UC8_02220 [Roseimaritima ulvae]
MAWLTKTIAAFSLAITGLSATSYADTYDHIDDLALRVASQSRQVVSETRHYRHTREYPHLVADAREMARLADHMHEVAHHHGSLSHLEADLNRLDSKFHHLESLFARIERHARHGYGHIHGNTSHVRSLLHSIEDNLHHLQDDVRSLRRPRHTVQPIVIPSRPDFYPAPRPYTSHRRGYDDRSHHHDRDDHRHRTRSRGITIGGGSSRITIGF